MSLTREDASATMPIARDAALSTSHSSAEMLGMSNDETPTDAFALPAQLTQGGLPSVQDVLQFSTRSRRRRRRGRSRNTLDEVSSQTIVPSVDNQELEEVQVLENTSFFKNSELISEPDSHDPVDDASESTDATEPHIIGSNSGPAIAIDEIMTSNVDSSSTDMDVISSEHHVENNLEDKPIEAPRNKELGDESKAPAMTDASNSSSAAPVFESPVTVQEAKPSWGLLVAGIALLSLVGFGVIGLFDNGPQPAPVISTVEPSDEAIRSVVAPGVPIAGNIEEPLQQDPVEEVVPEIVVPVEEPQPPPINEAEGTPVAEVNTASDESIPVPVPVPVLPEVTESVQQPVQSQPEPPVTVTPPQPIAPPPPSEPEPVEANQDNGAELQWGTESEPQAMGPTQVSIQANVSGVVVYVNGDRKGNTPLTVAIPKNQVAEIKAEKEGYTAQQKRIIPSGSTANVNFTLEAINTAPLQKVMLIAPVGVNVTISGLSLNIPGFADLPVGIHTATWTNSEGESKQKTFTVSGNGGGTQRISLE